MQFIKIATIGFLETMENDNQVISQKKFLMYVESMDK
jgi:hypothetical protein